MTGQAQSRPVGPAALLADYAPRPGVADELFDASGNMRPVWDAFIDQLGQLSPEEVQEHFARGDQYLRDAGVYFRQYSADPQQEREWPLSHIPVLLHESEWTGICEGLAQRADLLEKVVADIYGDGQLVRDGHLPASLIAQNPEWHRPLVGTVPPSGHFLHLIAFEIGRSPDGSWLVLGDRTQAPSGAGFALENRRATARIFPDPFPRANVRRLAGFFRTFRSAMDALPGAQGRNTAVLSPGPGNDTYFEHAYIARYLGLPLLEGDDLTVSGGAVHVRTVSGLQRVGVLWRRLDAAFADPLELDETSHIGTPGLVDAARQSNVNIVNALGAGILETRSLLAFLPKISEVLTGEKLRLPNIATWWCGQPSERDYVKANASKMVMGEALSRALPFDIGSDAVLGTAPGLEGEALAAWIDENAAGLVGQEAVTLSTTPRWVDGRLLPRPMSIRVFAARTPQGWTFLPGGYARVGSQDDAAALSMQQGGSVADVWIMCDRPTPYESVLDRMDISRADTGALPSRTADNFFWLGRYVERTEGAIRLLRGYHLRLAETGDSGDASVAEVARLLEALSLDTGKPVNAVIEPALSAARVCASKVRDRFSVDGWAALTDLVYSLEAMSGALYPGDDSARSLAVLLRKITGFNGLVHENMHRSSSWRFLTFGRALERADGAAAALAACIDGDEASIGLLEMALEYGDSHVTHQRRQRFDPTAETVTDLLALDANNPRSILFQVTAMRRIAADLPGAEVEGRVSGVLAMLLTLETDLIVAHPASVTPDNLADIRTALGAISGSLSAAYLA